MNIVIGSDHGGYELKEQVKDLLAELGHEITDVGCHSPESVDYPDIAQELSARVVDKSSKCGILICGTGIGMSIAVNRDERIRAALCHDEYTARMSREHNDANVLCLGARVSGLGVADAIVRAWLSTEFAGGRHQRRIEKFSTL
ncbi:MULTISPECIES: ribose 5-phosphate isomerase B [Desulfosediminicola]|uniref:ribose 5-phosphate isomerase B n=1 Tax=Desulfosediminicola TaxID=2886823 RepID=UPI0010AD6B90|nr:ribose 5-phosphate isomerase B [Desulfosediminicola ganghwensis]